MRKRIGKIIYEGKTFYEWEAIIGVAYSTIYGRWRKWQEGKFPEKDILYAGKLDSNQRKGRPIKKKVKGIDQSWLYRKERFITMWLKLMWLTEEY